MLWKHNTIRIYEQALQKLFRWGYRYEQAIPINKGRYQIIRGTPNLLLIYKERWFEKYGEMLKYKGTKGIGDSVNQEDLQKAEARGCRLIIRVDPELRLYAITLPHFRTKGVVWKNKEGKDVLSISIHAYTSCQCQEVVDIKAENHFGKILKATQRKHEVQEGTKSEIDYEMMGD